MTSQNWEEKNTAKIHSTYMTIFSDSMMVPIFDPMYDSLFPQVSDQRRLGHANMPANWQLPSRPCERL